jgi:hypothetical protein
MRKKEKHLIKLITHLMEPSTLIPVAIGWLPTCWKVLQDTGAVEAVKDSAKEYVELIGSIFSKNASAKKALEDLKETPENAKLQGKLEAHLETVLDNDPNIKSQLESLLKKLETTKSQTTFYNSKNIVNNSNLNAEGSIHIGDNTNNFML